MTTILGTSLDDTLNGSGVADFIVGYAGDDTLFGAGGDDVLRGGSGADDIDGGTGIDRADYRDSPVGIYVEYRNVSGFVADGVTGYLGSKLYGAGATSEGDYLVSVERIIGSSHDDWVVGNADDNYFYKVDGHDFYEGGGGSDWVDFSLASGTTGFVGSFSSGLFVQSSFTVASMASDDAGDFANDNFNASSNKLNMSSVENAIGSIYDDWIDGGREDNEIRGNAGDDFLFGGSGDDTLRGDEGNDDLRGGAHDDFLRGGDGNDLLFGGTQNDELRGDAGNDYADGGDGVDILRGGDGRDVLTGGDDASDDHLHGNAGQDTFVFYDGIGFDRIHDFEDGVDQVDLSQVSSLDNFGDVSAVMRQSGNHVIVDVGPNDTILFVNTDLTDLDAQDFVF